MNAGRIHNKVCLVTGAGSGIGRATAELMAREGATVVVSDVDLDAAKSVAEALVQQGQQAESQKLDVADTSSWPATMDRILADHGRLDVLVNSAGISISKPIINCTFEQWRKVMSVNLDGAFLGIKHAIAAMTNGGSIVNIASVSGINPMGGAPAYSASKAALRMLSKTVAIQCADDNSGVRVNIVSPGGVKTAMWEKESFFQSLIAEHGSIEKAFAALEGEALSQQFFSPEDVAKTVLHLASDAASHLTGVEIVMDRGYTG